MNMDGIVNTTIGYVQSVQLLIVDIDINFDTCSFIILMFSYDF